MTTQVDTSNTLSDPNKPLSKISLISSLIYHTALIEAYKKEIDKSIAEISRVAEELAVMEMKGN